MNVVALDSAVAIPHHVVDDRRGTWGMLLFILTEACLFVLLFFSYFYLGHVSRGAWPPEQPKVTLALVMLIILLASSGSLYWGERAERAGSVLRGRIGILVTLFLGVIFMVIQFFEYREHLKTLLPTSNAYGSIFYTITSFHAAHLTLGMLMLLYVLFLPEIGSGQKPPHRPLANAALYWHFVDVVWVFVVAILYVGPAIGIHR